MISVSYQIAQVEHIGGMMPTTDALIMLVRELLGRGWHLGTVQMDRIMVHQSHDRDTSDWCQFSGTEDEMLPLICARAAYRRYMAQRHGIDDSIESALIECCLLGMCATVDDNVLRSICGLGPLRGTMLCAFAGMGCTGTVLLQRLAELPEDDQCALFVTLYEMPDVSFNELFELAS